MTEAIPIFQHGASWIRADFHLHTKADKTFEYSGDENYFVSSYIEALNKAQISVGVITNHNLFDSEEFKALRKAAVKKNIFLLPGMELSVNDGANGIHTLVVFSNSWLENGHDYIDQFRNIAFQGKISREDERCSSGLIETIQKLEDYHKDYFIVFAHVEQDKGLWKELKGGRLKELSEHALFKKRVLGFQKVRTHDKAGATCRVQAQQWLGSSYPAELEGSDPKCLEEIGKGTPCYLKISAFSFDAVKFALIDHNNRVKSSLPRYKHSHITQIHFEGGTFNGQTISFSPELNTLIGIRGSGKSSILEILRYALDIPFGDKTGDKEYKEDLLGFTLGSGGKVVIDAIDRHSQPYQIRRIWKENFSKVYTDNKLQPGVSIRETVLHKPIYFGQKDLSNTGVGFEKDLVDKLLGSKLTTIQHRIAEQKNITSDAIDRLLKTTNAEEQIQEQQKIKQDTEFRLGLYQSYGIEEKLQKRLDFDADVRKMKEGIDLIDRLISAIKNLLANNEDDINDFLGHKSKLNSEIFSQFEIAYSKGIQSLENIKHDLSNSEKTKTELLSISQKIISTREGLVEEFAEVERKLAEELKVTANQNVSSDEFLQLKQKLVQINQFLHAFSKQEEQKTAFRLSLTEELETLNNLWHEEFQIIKVELDKVGAIGSALAISLGYKEDKAAFLSFAKKIFKGSNIREAALKNTIGSYPDFISIYYDFNNAKKMLSNNTETITDLFTDNLKTLLTYQTPNKFTITYHNKELAHHSLGQRASALILFVLSQRENDIIIIDQPEDDLDNQTIYEDVIKLVRNLKPKVQFIFATHNPNIPVLGDAEQIHACSFTNNSIAIQSGGIDNPDLQKTIVDIMEGGNEAFNRRKEIYHIWKP
jgi:chromosome segregation protein